MTGSLIVLVGPSGVGKGTVLKKVFEDLDRLVYSISVTTRQMRPGEVEAKNYFFRTRDQFHELVKKDEMLEWAEFVGNYYGTPKTYVEEQMALDNDVILEIEIEGAKQVKRSMTDAIFIFLAPPSIEVLYKRLKDRSTESEEKIKLRVERSREELEEAQSFGFDHYLVNEEGQVDRTAEELIGIIQEIRANKNL
jgi:guanylate kinase